MREKPLTEFIGSKKAAKEHKEKPAEPKVVGLKGPWKLPEGWRWVRLGEITEIIMGQSPPSKFYNVEADSFKDYDFAVPILS